MINPRPEFAVKFYASDFASNVESGREKSTLEKMAAFRKSMGRSKDKREHTITALARAFARFAPAPFASSEANGEFKERADAIAVNLSERKGKNLRRIVVSVTPRRPNLLPSEFRINGIEHYTFDFFPKQDHLKDYEDSDYWKQSIVGAVGHLVVSVSGKNAVITQIQGNAKPADGEVKAKGKKPEIGESVRMEYAGWQEALIEAARQFCREKGLKLWILKETVYREANSSYSAQAADLPSKYAPLRKKFALTKTPATDPVFERYQAYPIHRV